MDFSAKIIQQINFYLFESDSGPKNYAKRFFFQPHRCMFDNLIEELYKNFIPVSQGQLNESENPTFIKNLHEGIGKISSFFFNFFLSLQKLEPSSRSFSKNIKSTSPFSWTRKINGLSIRSLLDGKVERVQNLT